MNIQNEMLSYLAFVVVKKKRDFSLQVLSLQSECGIICENNHLGW